MFTTQSPKYSVYLDNEINLHKKKTARLVYLLDWFSARTTSEYNRKELLYNIVAELRELNRKYREGNLLPYIYAFIDSLKNLPPDTDEYIKEQICYELSLLDSKIAETSIFKSEIDGIIVT